MANYHAMAHAFAGSILYISFKRSLALCFASSETLGLLIVLDNTISSFHDFMVELGTVTNALSPPATLLGFLSTLSPAPGTRPS
jgi:hypothetical protein